MDFVARMIALRRRHPVFSRRRFLQGQTPGEHGQAKSPGSRPTAGR